MFSAILVDDEEMPMLSLQCSIQWEKYGFAPPVTFVSARQALDYLLDRQVDAAFVDIRMPEISGLDMICRCRDAGLATQFVIVSGYADFQYAQQALRLGAIDFLHKPVLEEETNALMEKLQKMLQEEHKRNDPFCLRQINNKRELLALLRKNGLDCAKPYLFGAIFPEHETSYSVLPDETGGAVFWNANGQKLLLATVSEPVRPGVPAVFFCISLASLPPSFSLYSLLVKMEKQYSEWDESSTELQVHPTDFANPAFASLMQYLESHYTEKLSLQKLSQQFNLNYTYCSELFSKTTGTSFSNYLTTLRLQYARSLLLEGHSVEDTAELSGFSSAQYFSTEFKKKYHISPSQYFRQSHANTNGNEEISK